MSLCELFKKQFYGIVSFQDIDGKNVTDCPLYPGKYVSYNQRIHDENFPPNIPPGAYKLRLAFLLNQKQILAFSGSGELVNKKI